MNTRTADGAEARTELLALLDRAHEQSRTVAFWWRDDDATTVTRALDRLLGLAERHGLPLALAVIPEQATEALADRLADEEQVSVLQHGWRHQTHNPDGEKKAELGDHRPLNEVLDELRAGFERMGALFPARFLPVLVPPWNRIGEAVRAERATVGLIGLSAFGQAGCDDPHRIDTHLDIFEWKPVRRPLPRARAFSTLCRAVAERLDGDPAPIGILTHHLVHEAESWNLLEELFHLLARHPAVAWPAIPELFRLTP